MPIELDHAGEHVTIIPPKGGYQAGSTYKLSIRNSVQSTEGMKAATKNEMTFRVATDYTPLTKKGVQSTTQEKQLYINGEKKSSSFFLIIK